jgi:hypothetical protein
MVRLKLRLTSRPDGSISALFRFYPKEMPADPRLDGYAFSLIGRYNPTGATQLRPQRWQTARPSGYVVVGMSGRFELAAGTFRGNISGGGCGAFNVTRDAALSAEAARPRERAARRTASSAPTPPGPPSPEPRDSGQAGSASVPSTSATSPARVVPQESAASKENRTNGAHEALFFRLNAPRHQTADGSYKSVGGLTCTMKIIPGKKLHTCDLTTDKSDPAAIYAALDVLAKKTAGPQSTIYTRRYGFLVCTKTERAEAVSYACDLTDPAAR